MALPTVTGPSPVVFGLSAASVKLLRLIVEFGLGQVVVVYADGGGDQKQAVAQLTSVAGVSSTLEQAAVAQIEKNEGWAPGSAVVS